MFYDNLLKICRERAVNITPIVEECGGKRGSIGGWKRGAWPNSRLVVALSERLNVSTDRLLKGNETKTNAALSQEGQKVAQLWESLDEPGRAMILGDIYRRLEVLQEEKRK